MLSADCAGRVLPKHQASVLVAIVVDADAEGVAMAFE
jgi:hypothetical protein